MLLVDCVGVPRPLRALRDPRPPGPAFPVSTPDEGVAGRELSGVGRGVTSVDVFSPSVCLDIAVGMISHAQPIRLVSIILLRSMGIGGGAMRPA